MHGTWVSVVNIGFVPGCPLLISSLVRLRRSDVFTRSVAYLQCRLMMRFRVVFSLVIAPFSRWPVISYEKKEDAGAGGKIECVSFMICEGLSRVALNDGNDYVMVGKVISYEKEEDAGASCKKLFAEGLSRVAFMDDNGYVMLGKVINCEKKEDAGAGAKQVRELHEFLC